ncbi:MAG: DUF3306 domain-containing protein [Burkholderiales bacterium]|nr:DUF3306 domain-containing protein [Burkholderiales bacterium]
MAPKDETFLQRWSRRKLAAARDDGAEPTGPAIEPPVAPSASSIEDRTPSEDAPSASLITAAQLPPLPAVESLTFESDFRAFLQPHVAEDLKRQALKKLLHDPRFNVMDGLDVYIDDYSVPSPLEPALARALAHSRYVFEPPQTRVSAQGYVEDVPAAKGDTPAEGQGCVGQAIEVRAAEDQTVEQREVANETVEKHLDQSATPPLSTPPDAKRDEGEASR